MFTDYVRAAMRFAHYEILGDGSFYGSIANLDGVFSNAGTLEECRDQLREVLEGWIILGLRMGHDIPEIDGISLNPELKVA